MKQATAPVSMGRDYDKMFEMIANLGGGVWAIGEIIGPAPKEQNPEASAPLLPLRQALDQFTKLCSERFHPITSLLELGLRGKVNRGRCGERQPLLSHRRG